jgi:hypothetical protein
LLLLQNTLLLFVLSVLTVQLALPELVHLIRGFILGFRWRRRLSLDLLLWSRRERGGVIVLSQEVWRVLRKLGDGDKTGEISKVGALIIELDQTIMLCVVTFSEGLKSVIVASRFESVSHKDHKE